MESPGKYEENETNRDLLQLTVQKLQFWEKNNSKSKFANLHIREVQFSLWLWLGFWIAQNRPSIMASEYHKLSIFLLQNSKANWTPMNKSLKDSDIQTTEKAWNQLAYLKHRMWHFWASRRYQLKFKGNPRFIEGITMKRWSLSTTICIQIPIALFGSYEAPCQLILKKFMRNEISWKIWRKWDQPRLSTINGSKVIYFEKKAS